MIKKLTIMLLLTILAFGTLQGCAIMHHTQIGEVDSDLVLRGRRFEVIISETGVNLSEAANITKAFTRNQKTRDGIQKVQDVIALFQMGPRTGNPVFSEEYADMMFSLMQKECPSGKMSGLTSIRETAKYPVISGEIVKIVGFCFDHKNRKRA